MRQIKFRGKRLDDGEWVAGWFVEHSRLDKSLIFSTSDNKVYSVDRKTVTQFIGVKGYEGDYDNRHQNEVELYEGDIVECFSQGSKGVFQIKFRNESQPTYILYPAWHNDQFWSIAASDTMRNKGNYFDNLKRIGNIFDNPELIKK